MKKRAIAFVLALTVLASLSSCAVQKGEDTAQADTPSVENADNQNAADAVLPSAPEETELKDKVPDDLDYDGTTITIFVSNGAGQNEKLYAGQGELTGDVENDAIIKRNMDAEERLNITLDYYGESQGEVGNIGSLISRIIMAGDDTYDMFLGNEYGHVTVITTGGLWNIDNLDYVDYSMPWWNNTYMDEMRVGEDARYFLVGDYIIETLRHAHTLFFNKNLYGDLFGGNTNEMYDWVLDGTWTIDRFAQTAEAAYADLNNNGVTDRDDRLGYITYLCWASVDPFAYLGDVPYSTHDENGYIQLNLLNEQAVTLAEKVVSFFHQPGSLFRLESDYSGAVFKEGRALFLGLQSLGTAQWYRDMEADYGFLPYPKLDENQQAYHTLVADNALIGSIPSVSKNLDKMGAVLEVLSYETRRTVIPAWYETALKLKYSRDDIASQIIDIIHDSTTTNFIYAYSNPLSGAGQIMRGMVDANSTDYASAVARMEKVAKKSLERLISSYEKNIQP